MELDLKIYDNLPERPSPARLNLPSTKRAHLSDLSKGNFVKLDRLKCLKLLVDAFVHDVVDTALRLTNESSVTTHSASHDPRDQRLWWEWLNSNVYQSHIQEMVAGFEAIFNKSDSEEAKTHDAKKRYRMRKLPLIAVHVMNGLEELMGWRALTIVNWLSCMPRTRR